MKCVSRVLKRVWKKSLKDILASKSHYKFPFHSPSRQTMSLIMQITQRQAGLQKSRHRLPISEPWPDKVMHLWEE